MVKVGLRDLLAPWIRIGELKNECDRLRMTLAFERQQWAKIGVEIDQAQKHLDKADNLKETLNAK